MNISARFNHHPIEFNDSGIEMLAALDRAEKKEFYVPQYKALHNFCKTSSLESDDIRIISMAIYAWMPTMLKGKDHELSDDLIKILKSAKENHTLISSNDLKFVAKFMNNSFVGASKLLHFLNPELYPIWDSVVARHYGYKYRDSYNKADVYFSFIEAVKNIGSSDMLDDVKKLTSSIHDMDVSTIRAVEFYLWITNKEIKRTPSKAQIRLKN